MTAYAVCILSPVLGAIMTLARDLLNKLKWTGKLKGCEIVILHRGTPSNKRVINSEQITEIKKSNFMYKDKKGFEIFIPMHRVLEIRMRGKVVWKRNKKGEKK